MLFERFCLDEFINIYFYTNLIYTKRYIFKKMIEKIYIKGADRVPPFVFACFWTKGITTHLLLACGSYIIKKSNYIINLTCAGYKKVHI